MAEPDLISIAEEAERKPAPGWYPDPDGSGDQRFWDGTRWTSKTTTATSNGTLVVAGYASGLVFAPLGAIIAFVLLGRGDRNGWRVLACASTVMLLGLLLIFL